MSLNPEVSLQRFTEARAEKQKKDRQRQLQLGFCDKVLPSLESGIITSALAVDKNRIFVVNSFREKYRVFEREIRTPLNKVVTQRVFVGRTPKSNAVHGVLKQKHQEAMYELFRLWVERGRRLITVNDEPRAFMVATVRQLAKTICGSTGGRSYHYVRNVLRDMSSIPIHIENAYTSNGLATLEFSILGEVTWSSRKGGASEVYIQFSPITTKSFLDGYVRGFSLDVYKEIGKGSQGPHKAAAMVLYDLLDVELSKEKQVYSISLTRLLSILGLCAYQHKSKRKGKMTPVIEAVNGREICGGKHLLSVVLYFSKNLNDYVLEAHKQVAGALHRFLSVKVGERESYSASLGGLLSDLGFLAHECRDKRKKEIEVAIRSVDGRKTCDETGYLRVNLCFSERLNDYVLQARKLPTDSMGQRMLVL